MKAVRGEPKNTNEGISHFVKEVYNLIDNSMVYTQCHEHLLDVIAMKLGTFHFAKCLFLFMKERVPCSVSHSFRHSFFHEIHCRLSGNFIVAYSLDPFPSFRLEFNVIILKSKHRLFTVTINGPSSTTVTTITFIALVAHLIMVVFFSFPTFSFYFTKMNCSSWTFMATIFVG